MSRRALIFLVIVLVVGLAWLTWFDERCSAPEGEAPVRPLIDYAPDVVRAIEIVNQETEGRLERDEHGKWWVIRPIRWEADPGQVDALLRDLSEVSVLGVVAATPGGDLDDFGLSGPEGHVVLFGDGEVPTHRFELGGTSPLGDERYVRDDTGAVLLVDGSIGRILRRVPGSFMERRFVPVAHDEVRAIAVRGPTSAFRLERRGDQWWLTEPFEDLADRGMVTDMVWALDSLVATKVLDAREIELARGAFDESVTLTFDTGGGNERLGVEIGASAGPDRWFARRTGDTSFWGIVEATALRLLAREAGDLRERHLAVFSRREVRAVRIHSAEGGLSLVRLDPQTWEARMGERAPQEVPGAPVEAFLDRLRWMRAGGFGDGSKGSAGPAIEIVLSGESAELGRLVLEPLGGVRTPDGAAVLRARTSWRRGFVFTVAADSLDAIPRTVDDLRDRSEVLSRGDRAQ